MTTGEKIKKLRLEKGLTQKQFGDIINKPHSAISKIEKGLQTISIKDIYILVKALDVTIFDIIHVPTNILMNEIEKREKFISDFYGG